MAHLIERKHGHDARWRDSVCRLGSGERERAGFESRGGSPGLQPESTVSRTGSWVAGVGCFEFDRNGSGSDGFGGAESTRGQTAVARTAVSWRRDGTGLGCFGNPTEAGRRW